MPSAPKFVSPWQIEHFPSPLRCQSWPQQAAKFLCPGTTEPFIGEDPPREQSKGTWYVPKREERNTQKKRNQVTEPVFKTLPGHGTGPTYNRIKTWWLIYSCSQRDELRTRSSSIARCRGTGKLENLQKVFPSRKSAGQSAFCFVRVELYYATGGDKFNDFHNLSIISARTPEQAGVRGWTLESVVSFRFK